MLRRIALVCGLAIAFAAPAAAQSPPPPAPRVTLETTMGAVTITLDPVGAPLTTAHMLRLFRRGHYVGAVIFRVEPGFLIQLGDLDAKLQHRNPPPGRVPLETATTRHARGTVSLAREDDPGSGKSSFYFDLAPNRHLNADPKAAPNTTGYTAFGRVTSGMAVLDRMAAVELDPTAGPYPGKLPKTPIVVTKVTVE